MSGAREAIEALYREVVLEHYRKPRNRRALDDADASALAANPVCGDQVRVDVRLHDGRVAEATARSRGCSIAVAAGSVMTELVPGLDPGEVGSLADEVKALVEGRADGADLDPRLRAFARVADLPSRRRCALLPWEALAEALAEARAS